MQPNHQKQSGENAPGTSSPAEPKNTASSAVPAVPAATKQRRAALYVTQGAVIAALYVALTELSTLVGLSSGAIQFRISEALCILPAFTPAAIPGLFVGCLISNLLAGGIPLDIIFGAVATLIGAAGAYLLRRCRWLVPLPTVIANVLIVPPILKYAYGVPYALGTPVLHAHGRHRRGRMCLYSGHRAVLRSLPAPQKVVFRYVPLTILCDRLIPREISIRSFLWL